MTMSCNCGCECEHDYPVEYVYTSRGGFGKFLFGCALGAGVALLITPNTGKENRKILKKKIEDLYDYLSNLDYKEVGENIMARLDDLKKDLEAMDKETALRIAREQRDKIVKKANELYEYSKEKATPHIEKMTRDIKDKTLVVAKDVVKKLEDSEKKDNKMTKKSTK